MNRKQLVALGLFIAVVTTIPYLIAAESQDDSWIFTGFLFGVEDGNSYLAKMLYGDAGGWLFRSPYSTFEQRGVLAFVPYILLGKLAFSSEPHTQLMVLFHIFRLAAIFIAVFVTYKFIARYVASQAWRIWATLVGLLGGGMGWLLIALGSSEWLGSPPLEFYSPESFGFLAVFGIPHLVLSRALMLAAILFYLEAFDSPKRGWVAGALLVLLGLVHPVSMVTFAIIIGSHSLLSIFVFRDRPFWQHLDPSIRTLVPAIPLFLYFGYSFLSDPYLIEWTEQNIIRSPHPAHYLLAYGLLIIPAIKGAITLLRTRKRDALLPVAWMLLLPFLAYAPHNLQRRLPEGIWIAVVILAAIGLSKWSMSGRALRLAFSVPLMLSTVFIVYGAIQFARDPGEPIFRDRQEVRAFNEIRKYSIPGEVVLSSFEVGNPLPAWAPVRVVIGHGPETINLGQLEAQVAQFYSGEMSRAEARHFLIAQNAALVFYGPVEQKLGPIHADLLELVYREGSYAIFRTRE